MAGRGFLRRLRRRKNPQKGFLPPCSLPDRSYARMSITLLDRRPGKKYNWPQVIANLY